MKFQAFLTIDDDQPLGVWVSDDCGFSVIALDRFLGESKIDMSKEIAGRYAEKLQAFVDELKEYSGGE